MLGILAIDLGLLNRRSHTVSIREALGFTGGLIVLAAVFAVLVWFGYDRHWMALGTSVDSIDGLINTGHLAVLKFVTGYLIELSLSADNVFVMAMIFAHLRIPGEYQHRVLFWGILGALVLRGVMILVGTALIARYHWILYVFGLFLLVTAFRMARSHGETHISGDEAFIIRHLRRFVPITGTFHGHHFLALVDGRRMLTPLAVALVLVEAMDVVFALDSIPAAFAITADPFLVFTSNVFAILGLRSLYFVLAGAIRKFRYLTPALSVILGLVGLKMLGSDLLKEYVGSHANLWVMALVILILAASVTASILVERRERTRPT